MKIAKNIHHVIDQYCKGFQGHRSNIKVIARPNAIFRRRHIDRWLAVYELTILCTAVSCIIIMHIMWALQLNCDLLFVFFAT